MNIDELNIVLIRMFPRTTPGGIPAIKRGLVPLRPEERSWLSVWFTGYRQAAGGGYCGHILGTRSDGQLFAVASVPPEETMPTELTGRMIREIEFRLAKARDMFETYRDCSCGIIGYKTITDPEYIRLREADGDEGPFEVAIHSPCATHPKLDK